MANDKQKNEQYIYQQTQNAIRNHSNQQNDFNIAWDKLQAVTQLNAAEQNATDSFEKGRLQEKLDLMKAKDIVIPSTANITNEAIQRLREREKNIREQEKNDAIFRMDERARIEAYLKTKGWDITKQNIKNIIEKKLDERLLAAKLKHHQEQMAQKRPQSTQLQIQQVSKQVVAQVLKGDVGSNAALQRRNEQARQGYAQQLAQQKASNQGLIQSYSAKIQALSNQNTEKQTQNNATLGDLSDKISNFFKSEIKKFKQEFSTLLSPLMPDKNNKKSNSAFSISTPQNRKVPTVPVTNGKGVQENKR